MNTVWGRFFVAGARKTTYGRWHALDVTTTGRPIAEGGERTLCNAAFERWQTQLETPHPIEGDYSNRGEERVCRKCLRKVDA